MPVSGVYTHEPGSVTADGQATAVPAESLVVRGQHSNGHYGNIQISPAGDLCGVDLN